MLHIDAGPFAAWLVIDRRAELSPPLLTHQLLLDVVDTCERVEVQITMQQRTAWALHAATPMLHVPDVRAAAAWYESIGFTLLEIYDDGAAGLSFAILSAGATRVMFNQGGRRSTEWRREVDLYLDVESVDDVFASLDGRAEIVRAPHDTHYGMRELIIRDLNRFWITFGQDLRAG